MQSKLTQTQIEALEALARADAREAVRHGATAPWGDGETLPDARDLPKAFRETVDLEAVKREICLAYDRAFRAEIDAVAPKAVAQ